LKLQQVRSLIGQGKGTAAAGKYYGDAGANYVTNLFGNQISGAGAYIYSAHKVQKEAKKEQEAKENEKDTNDGSQH
jgi:hypothetical protein